MSLPVTDPEYIRSLIEAVRQGKLTDVRLFFILALEGYYSPMLDGMNRDVGHFLYRLSDLMPAEDRAKLKIYPNYESGSLVDNGVRWDTLEDFRREWAKSNPHIPQLDLLRSLEALNI